MRTSSFLKSRSLVVLSALLLGLSLKGFAQESQPSSEDSQKAHQIERIRNGDRRSIHVRDRWSLRFVSQIIRRSSRSDDRELFYHLAEQNTNAEGQRPQHLRSLGASLRNLERIVRQTSRHWFYKTRDGRAIFRVGNIVTEYKGFDFKGVIQSDRRPGYIRGRFHTGNALELPKDERFSIAFSERAPSHTGLEDDLRADGLDPDDYFFIWFLPERFSWAIGERVPLIPYAIHRSRLNGLTLDDLDFNSARYIARSEALRASNALQDNDPLLEAGFHIPVKNKPEFEPVEGEHPDVQIPKIFDLPTWELTEFYEIALSTFLKDIALGNIRFHDELWMLDKSRSEDLVAYLEGLLRKYRDQNPAQRAISYGVLAEPSYAPDESRAKQKGLSTNWAMARLGRAVDWLARDLTGLAKWSDRQLSKDPSKSSLENRWRYRGAIKNYNKTAQALAETRWGLRRVREQPNYFDQIPILENIPEEPEEANKTTEGRRKRILHWARNNLPMVVMSAIPWALMSNHIIPLFQTDGARIAASFGFTAGATGLTVLAIKTMLYLRNVFIRDAQALGLLHDEPTQDDETNVLEEGHEEPHQRTPSEYARLTERIGERPEFSWRRPFRSLASQVGHYLNPIRLQRALVSSVQGDANNPERREALEQRVQQLDEQINVPATSAAARWAQRLSPRMASLRVQRWQAQQQLGNIDNKKKHDRMIRVITKVTKNGTQPAIEFNLTQWIFSKSNFIYRVTHPHLPRLLIQVLLPQYMDVRSRGGRASLSTMFEDWGLVPLYGVQAWKMATYLWGGVSAATGASNFRPDSYWERLNNRREASIQKYRNIEPAIGQAIGQLEIAFGLELGFEVETIQAMRSVVRSPSYRGEGWIHRVLQRLPHSERITEENVQLYVRFARMLRSLANANTFWDKMSQYYDSKPEYKEKTSEEIVDDLAMRAKSNLADKLKEEIERTEDELFYTRAWPIVKSLIDQTRYELYSGLYKMGQSAENVVNRAMLTLGHDGSSQLLDRIPTSIQSSAGMVASLPPGASDIVFHSSTAPIYNALVPQNIVRGVEGLALNTRLMDSLDKGRVVDPEGRVANGRFNLGYLGRIINSAPVLPFRQILHNRLAVFDQTIPAAATTATITFGLLVPVNAALHWIFADDVTWTSLKGGTIALGMASLITAGASVTFGFGSQLYYGVTQTWRRAVDQRHPASRLAFAAVWLLPNIWYGQYVGYLVNRFGPSFLETIPAMKEYVAEHDNPDGPRLLLPSETADQPDLASTPNLRDVSFQVDAPLDIPNTLDEQIDRVRLDPNLHGPRLISPETNCRLPIINAVGGF